MNISAAMLCTLVTWKQFAQNLGRQALSFFRRFGGPLVPWLRQINPVVASTQANRITA